MPRTATARTCSATTRATRASRSSRAWRAWAPAPTTRTSARSRSRTTAASAYDTATDAEHRVGKQDGKRTIFNLRYKDYMWLDDRSPYVSGKGDPEKDSAQWVIDGLPESW
jgi:hypothetical protein